MDTIDVAVSFDTTGSMFPCLTQVRRVVDELTNKLFDRIPGIRMAIMSHGDYCDGKDFLSKLDFTDDRKQVCRFIDKAPSTGGGDSPEAYEAVLKEARSLNWSAGRNRALVVIGDAEPHKVGYSTYRGGYSHTNTIDWKNEASLLKEMSVNVYSVQCLNYRESDYFYEGLAELTDGKCLDLNQFSYVADMLTAIVFQRANKLAEFSSLLKPELRSSPTIQGFLSILEGKTTRKRARTERIKSEHALHAVDPARFQILEVDRDCCIKTFVEDNGLGFRKGRGFYEFTKSVKVQSYKEVIIQDRETEEMFSGDKARQLLGIPVGENAQVRPEKMTKYRGFIQSTSNNRKLLGGTHFLYEVDGSR